MLLVQVKCPGHDVDARLTARKLCTHDVPPSGFVACRAIGGSCIGVQQEVPAATGRYEDENRWRVAGQAVKNSRLISGLQGFATGKITAGIPELGMGNVPNGF